MISHVPYWVAYEPDTFPQDFILEFLRKGMKDRIRKNRELAFEGVKTFYRPDLLPELREASARETDPQTASNLSEIITFLEQGFYWLPFSGPKPSASQLRVFVGDGTFLELAVPFGCPPNEVKHLVETLRSKPLAELKALQLEEQRKRNASRESLRKSEAVQAQSATEARQHGGACPHCGFVYAWDGSWCNHCETIAR